MKGLKDERGVLTMPGSGRRWVVDCVTGKLIDIREARSIGWSQGKYYWIHKKRSILGIPRERLVAANG